MECGQTGAVSFVDGQGDDGLVQEGLWQCGNGGERTEGLQSEFDEIVD
jgi:hypothetical protein